MMRSNRGNHELPLNICGSSNYGRFPKINPARTFNCILSDNWLVDYPGYAAALTSFGVTGKGRGIYKSTRLNALIVVIYNAVYQINTSFSVNTIGFLNSLSGDVFIAEDTQGHIAVCDKQNIWIYTNNPFSWELATGGASGTDPLDFLPGYISYQNGRFISVDLQTSTWRLSNPSEGNTQFPFASAYVGTFQTKSDLPLAAFPVPGQGNLLFVMGSTVGELWTDIGAALFPYQRATGVNIDYGLANADTVSFLDNYVFMVTINERANLSIMISMGGLPTRVSTDGIDYQLGKLTQPTNCHGFAARFYGHIIYQVVWPADNFSIVYDATTNKFFDVTDPYMNYHIAKKIAFFNGDYYFVSLNDPNLYQMSNAITTQNGNQIPRIRVCDTIRMPNTQPFVVNNIAFPIEQGIDDYGYTNGVIRIVVTNGGTGYTAATVKLLAGNGHGATATATVIDGAVFSITVTNPGLNYDYSPIVQITGNGTGATAISVVESIMPRCDLSISNDGGYQFGNYDGMQLNALGTRQSLFAYYNLGWCNEFTAQFRFWSYGRLCVGQGVAGIYQ